MPINFFENWQKWETKVSQYVEDRCQAYYASDCYSKLKKRIEKLNDSIDLRFSAGNRTGNAWESKFIVPLVREQYITRKSSLRANFSADPLFTLEPIGSTPYENAVAMSDVLNNNIKRTRFREKAMGEIITMSSRWGAAVSIASYHENTRKYKKTMAGVFGTERREIEEAEHQVKNGAVNPMNYYQNPSIADPEASDYRGHIERIFLSDLIEEFLANRGVYVAENLEKLIKEVKKSPSANQHRWTNGNNDNWKWLAVDIQHYWGFLHLDGNEDDQTIYYIQKAGNHIIRFQDNPHDENVVPYALYTLDKRLEYWWGNTDIENVIPAENVANLLMNVATDNALRQMEHYLFIDAAAGINPADLANKRKNGGWMRFENKGTKSVRDMFFEYQSGELSMNALDYANRENKESAQRLTSKVDLARNAQQGGPQNKTATAAMLMDERSNVIEADYNNNFANGLKETGRINCVLLQQYLPDQFDLTARPTEARRQVEKSEILGQYDYELKTSYHINKAVRQNNLLNFITALMNFKNVDPSWGNVDFSKLRKKWAETYDLGVDLDDIMPEAEVMQGEVPSMMIPGSEIGGAVGPAPDMGMATPPQMQQAQPPTPTDAVPLPRRREEMAVTA